MPNPKRMTLDELNDLDPTAALMPYHIPVIVPRAMYHRFFDVLAGELGAVAVGCDDDWARLAHDDVRVMFAPGRMPNLVVGGTRARERPSAPYAYRREFTRIVRELGMDLVSFTLIESDLKHILGMC